MKDKSCKLHPIDAFGISKVSLNSIRIERLEQRIIPTVAFPHKHDFYQLILITEGSGQHEIDFKLHRVAKNQLYIMKPGQIHTWTFDPGIKGYVIEFNRNSLPHLISELDNTPDVVLLKKKQDHQQMESLITFMLAEFKNAQEMMDLSLQGYLTAFLVLVHRVAGVSIQGKSVGEPLQDKFRHLVEQHFKQEHRVDFYAKALGLSSKALTMQLTRSLGRAPRLIIQDRFLLEAKRYLAYSDLSIAEIGYEIGFEDANYFTRFFRLHERQTPAQFRVKSFTRAK